MTTPVIWMDSPGYAEARGSISDWAALIGPQDWPQRPWQETLEAAEGAVITARYCFDGELFARATRLRIVARLGVGHDNVDLRAATAAGVCVTSTPGATTDSVAEHTVGLLLALARHFGPAEQLLRQGDWQARQRLVGTELRGKTLGVIGLGRIGSRVARICRVGLEMEVLAFDPYLSQSAIRERFAEPVDALGDLIARSDAITLHVPATAETYHMINEATLACARRGAVLINTARGTVVDADVLAGALRAGYVAGAALDVFEPEPLPAGFALLDAPNLLVTPHLAGSTVEAQRRVGLDVAEDVQALFQGRQPARLLNPEVWAHRQERDMSTESDAIIKERLARNQSFWLRAPAPRPLLGVAVNITFPLLTFADSLEDGRVTPDQIRAEAYLEEWDRVHAQAAARGEDLLSVASPFAGIPWMEAIAGCSVRVVPGSGSVWAEYPDGMVPDPREVRFDPTNAWLRKLVECTRALRDHAASRYPVGAPIMRGVSDMIAAMLGGNQMVYAYYDRPGLIRELSERCTEIWHGVACALAEAKGSFMGGSCADRRRVWGRGTSLLYQDDAVALASPRLFREFFLPRIGEILRPYTNTMIHLHSASLPIMARDLCSLPELRAIEVLLDPTGPQLIDLLETFRDIMRQKALVISGEMTAQEVRACIEALPGAGLCLQPKASSAAEADLLWRETTARREAATEDATEHQR